MGPTGSYGCSLGPRAPRPVWAPASRGGRGGNEGREKVSAHPSASPTGPSGRAANKHLSLAAWTLEVLLDRASLRAASPPARGGLSGSSTSPHPPEVGSPPSSPPSSSPFPTQRSPTQPPPPPNIFPEPSPTQPAREVSLCSQPQALPVLQAGQSCEPSDPPWHNCCQRSLCKDHPSGPSSRHT